MQLEQRKYVLKLNTELAKAKAEERVYSEAILDEPHEAMFPQRNLSNQIKAENIFYNKDCGSATKYKENQRNTTSHDHGNSYLRTGKGKQVKQART